MGDRHDKHFRSVDTNNYRFIFCFAFLKCTQTGGPTFPVLSSFLSSYCERRIMEKIHKSAPSILTEVVLFCIESANFSFSRCAKLEE